MAEQTTLRDQLEANFEASGNNELNVAQDAPEIVASPVIETETAEQQTARERDERGRFASKEPVEVAPVEAVAPAIQRPTTWKKEYLPIWDKLTTGQQLTPEEALKLAEYSNQRETEYKTGVSTYKTEAEQARQLQDAIAPFMPTLQQNNIQPSQWIRNLGTAHQTLVYGSPEQKLQMFAQLAQEYGVPLQAVNQMQQQGGIDPQVAFLMNQIQNLSGQVNTVTSWREQQEQDAAQQEIAKLQNDAEKYPYFEQVRGQMSQLLEKGLASDLETAYHKAIRLNDEVWEQQQAHLTQAAQAQNLQQKAVIAQKAKANAVSPRTSTPSGSTTNSTAKDRRSMLAEQVDAAFGGRL